MKDAKMKLLSAAVMVPLLGAPAPAQADLWCLSACALKLTFAQLSCGIATDTLIAGCVFHIPTSNSEEISNCMADAGDFYDDCIAIAEAEAEDCGANCC